MDKIKELLAQMGASEEVVAQICEAFDSWKEAQGKQLDEEFKARLAKAKEVCMEEVSTHKRDISRRVEIFLEAQIASIERSGKERMAIEESEAVNTLKRTKAMLEGIKIDSDGSDLQAVQDENDKLRQSIVKISEEKDQVSVKFQRASKVAENALARNKTLEEQLATASEKKPPVTESKGTKLDGERKESAKPKTTRRTLTESQKAGKQEVAAAAEGDDDIGVIAEAIDDIP
jgi:hypothetical protein